MCPKRVEKKKLLVRHKKIAKWLFNYFLKNTEAATRGNFAIFTGRTGKHLCWSLFLILNIAKF